MHIRYDHVQPGGGPLRDSSGALLLSKIDDTALKITRGLEVQERIIEPHEE